MEILEILGPRLGPGNLLENRTAGLPHALRAWTWNLHPYKSQGQREVSSICLPDTACPISPHYPQGTNALLVLSFSGSFVWLYLCVCVSERERESYVWTLCGHVCLSVYVCPRVHAYTHMCYECGHHSCARHAQAHTMAGSGTVSPLPTNLQIANFQRCGCAFHQPQVRVKLQLALHLLLLTILQLYHLPPPSPPPVSSSSLPVHSVPAPVCPLMYSTTILSKVTVL